MHLPYCTDICFKDCLHEVCSTLKCTPPPPPTEKAAYAPGLCWLLYHVSKSVERTNQSSTIPKDLKSTISLFMMAGSSLSRINGLGEFCMPADGCRGRCAKHKPCRIADRYECRWKLLTGWSFALYVSFSFLPLHLFCCIRTYGLHCPRPCASFRGYSPPVAMNVVVFQ